MASLPRKFKQAVFKEAGAPLTIEETILTLPGHGELLVKVDACGVCASDVYAQAGAWGGGFPFVPGHEYIGHVAAIGKDVSQWKVGDRVAGGWHGGHDGKRMPSLTPSIAQSSPRFSPGPQVLVSHVKKASSRCVTID